MPGLIVYKDFRDKTKNTVNRMEAQVENPLHRIEASGSMTTFIQMSSGMIECQVSPLRCLHGIVNILALQKEKGRSETLKNMQI